VAKVSLVFCIVVVRVVSIVVFSGLVIGLVFGCAPVLSMNFDVLSILIVSWCLIFIWFLLNGEFMFG